MSKSFFGSDNNAQQLKSYWNKTKDKCSDFMEDIKSDPKFAGAVNLAKTHRKETFFIVLMAIGILIGFFHWIGGFIVGVVSTVCLPWDLLLVWKKAFEFYEKKGQFKAVILGLVGLFLLVKVPSLLIGAAFGLGVNLFLKSDVSRPAKEGIQESAKQVASQFEKKDKK